MLPTTQFAYREGLGTRGALLLVSHTLQSALVSESEAMIVQVDFTASFDRVNHQGILYKLCYVGIGGSVLSIFTQFISNRPQHIIANSNCCLSKLVKFVSGVPLGREALWAHYCSSCTPRSCFLFWRISRSVMAVTPLSCLLCHPHVW